jgi:hypothetical protein
MPPGALSSKDLRTSGTSANGRLHWHLDMQPCQTAHRCRREVDVGGSPARPS